MVAKGAVLDGRYVLEEKIGSGGSGEVWRARHLTLNSVAAVKLLHVSSSACDQSRARFLREARVTAQLRIRQAVQVHDFGIADAGRPYLVMELLEGETLGMRIAREGRLDAAAVVNILRLSGRALERAHAMGIVHRDFKPDNVFLVPDEEQGFEVKVVDFGIAKLVGGFERPSSLEQDDPLEEPPSEIPSGGRPLLQTFTRTGGIMGTPYYMPPEQVRAEPEIGPEADIWAFGIVAYQCLTGRRPFEAPSAVALFKRILERTYLPAHEICPDIPTSFDDWFQVACALQPSQRFPDIRSAVQALEMSLGTSFSDTSFVGMPHVSTTSTAGTESSLVGLAVTQVSGRTRLAVVIGAVAAVMLIAASAVLLSRQSTATAYSEPVPPVEPASPPKLVAPSEPLAASAPRAVAGDDAADPEAGASASAAPVAPARSVVRPTKAKPAPSSPPTQAPPASATTAAQPPPEPTPKKQSPLELPPLGL